MQVKEKFKFRVSGVIGRITYIGVILSWMDGVVDILDSDLKFRTFSESRIISMDRLGVQIEPGKQNVESNYKQMDLFDFLQ